MNRLHVLALLTGTLLSGSAIVSSPAAAGSFPEPRIEAAIQADQAAFPDRVQYRDQDDDRDDDRRRRRGDDEDEDDARSRRDRDDSYRSRGRDRYDDDRDRFGSRRSDRDYRVPGILAPPAFVLRRCFPARPYFTRGEWRCRPLVGFRPRRDY